MTATSENQGAPVHSNSSNVPFAPILFQGENVMALPAQWVFAHLTPRVEQFVTTADVFRSPYQTTQPPPPLLMLPASTATIGIGSTAAGGGRGSLETDPLAEYERRAQLEAQGRVTNISLDIAMAMQDERPMFFVLSRFQPSNVTHVAAVPSPPMPPPQPTEENLHDMLMVSDMYTMDNLPRDDAISMGSFDRAGMTISPADTMNSPLHSSLTPAMSALSAATPNMIDSPYLPTKDEPDEGEGCDYDDDDDEPDDENDVGMDEVDDNDNDNDNYKDNRSSSIDNTMTNNNDNDAKLKSKRNECSVCHKTFTRRSNLKTHEKLHTRTHAVACHLCGCTFSRQPDLNRHLQAIHEGARIHACEKCGRSFSRKDAWRVHQSSCKRTTPQAE